MTDIRELRDRISEIGLRVSRSRLSKLTDEQKKQVVEKVKERMNGGGDQQDETEPVDDTSVAEEVSDTEVVDDTDTDTDTDTETDTDIDTETDEDTDSQEGGDDLMQSVNSLSEEIEKVKADGRIDSSEVVGLFNNMMNMVNTLLRAKPGRNPRASLEVRVASQFVSSRGMQLKRKDKDLMSDTGGASKIREREPDKKPPREDMKKPFRTKDKPSNERDQDTDNDKDKSVGKDKDMKRSSVHPLDRKIMSNFGFEIPEDNYYRQVWSSMTNIITSKRGISEKSFTAYDGVMSEVDQLLRTPQAMEMIARFEHGNYRAEFCAESLFSAIKGES